MTFSASIVGAKRLQKKFSGLSDAVKSELGKEVLNAAKAIHKTAIDSISRGTRTGRLYKVTKGGKMHQASAPGEPPKTRSPGAGLVSSITIESFKEAQGTRATVGSRSSAPYGRMLEYGTSRMAPRPWLRPALEKVAPKFKQMYIEAIKRAMKRVL